MESSTLSFEFIAAKKCVEDVHYFLYKMRIFDILLLEVHGANKFCDNKIVVMIFIRVESVLNNECSSICYNGVLW